VAQCVLSAHIMKTLLATLLLMLGNVSLAYADIACPSGGVPPCNGPPTAGGGGCSMAVANPSGALAIGMILLGVAFLAANRLRKRA
jgi:hypothetical protein